jgi:tetratricopeptide (TPR) repeat protein
MLFIITCGNSGSGRRGDPKFIDDSIEQYNLGNYNDALRSFERFFIEDETSPTAAYSRAWKAIAYEALDKPDHALLCVEKALTIKPDDADFWKAKERFLFASNKDTEAAKVGRKTASLETGMLPSTTTSLPLTNATPTTTTTLIYSRFTEQDRLYLAITQTQITIPY